VGGEARTALAGLLWGATGQNSCDLSIDQLRTCKGLVRVRFEYKENRRRGPGMGEGERHRTNGND